MGVSYLSNRGFILNGGSGGGQGDSSANLGSKTITSNGIYLPTAEDLDGYDYVLVNVPTGSLPAIIITPIIGTAEKVED